jgi:DNA-directed RNA polymerase subunit RPC12/RpoP
MAATDLINLSGLVDDAKCFAFVRQQRWPEGVRCPSCASDTVIRDGRDDTQPYRQRYRCKTCGSRFDDLTGTVWADHQTAAARVGAVPLLHGPEHLAAPGMHRAGPGISHHPQPKPGGGT